MTDSQLTAILHMIALHKCDKLSAAFAEIRDKIPFEIICHIFAFACRYGDPDIFKTLVDCNVLPDNSKPIRNSLLYFLDGCPYMSIKNIHGVAKNINMSRDLYYHRIDESKIVEPISKETRLASLEFLLRSYTSETLDAGRLLYYAIITMDEDFIKLLKSHNVTLPDDIKDNLFTTNARSNNCTWYDFISLRHDPAMYEEKFLSITERLRNEYPAGKIEMDNTNSQQFMILNPNLTDRLINSFQFSKISKGIFMSEYFDVKFFPIYEKLGWLSNRKTRENLMDRAQRQNNIEITAWLLDYVNRTVDIEKERRDDEKRALRELTAAPDSVYALQKIWGYKKIGDTVCITSCKQRGTKTLNIPDKIGKSPVTAIEFSYRYDTSNIETLNIPEGVTYVSRGRCEFSKLQHVTLPSTLQKIKDFLFENSQIESVEIPSGCEEISSFAFSGNPLKHVTLPEGLEVIKYCAFCACNLSSVRIPRSVKDIDKTSFDRFVILEVYRDSYAHRYFESIDALDQCIIIDD